MAPVRFFGQEPSVPVIIEFSVRARKEEQKMPPAFFMKDEPLCLRVPLCDRFRFGESLLICSVGIAADIVVEVATVAVDDEYDWVTRREHTLSPQRSDTATRGG